AEARRAIEVACSHGWGIGELEARQLLAECAIVHDAKAAREAAAALAARALELGSPRFAAEAKLLSLASASSFDVVALEELAASHDVAPCAARRARALLGEEPAPGDEVDRAVLARSPVRAAVRLRTIDPNGGGPWRRGWGVDVARKLLLRSDGTTVALERHALLLRMLLVLADHGGAATFEQIAENVWGIRSFHPLRDANRVRVTMHRLRALVETSDGEPKHIVLRDAGYAIGSGPFRIVEPA
ncbi:MAG TPA: helix-turn-helix domain-containing protein, partial [Labilithrix sp.]|nr:helix-turn-helix domain-containing protein [Labilithrix sp.]